MLDLLCNLLKAHRLDEEKWKRHSRKIIDALLPLLSQRAVRVRNSRVLNVIHLLYDSVHPIALRPLIYPLRCMFSVALPSVALRLEDGTPLAMGLKGVAEDVCDPVGFL